jgi:hypothetical protein
MVSDPYRSSAKPGLPTRSAKSDHRLNTAIKKIRVVLGDSADNPRFVETVARRGYRFLAPVAEAANGAAADQTAYEIDEMTGNVAENRRRWHVLPWAVVVILSLALTGEPYHAKSRWREGGRWRIIPLLG